MPPGTRKLAPGPCTGAGSSLNAYRNWPPGPVGKEDGEPTWDTDEDDYGPDKAHAERVLGAALGDRFLTARAGRVVVPETVGQPIAVVDARDLAGWLVTMAERGQGGPVNATGPAGMTTLGGLLELCREVTVGDAEFVPVPEVELLAVDVQPWVHLPLWLPADIAPTAWDVDTTRARELGLPSRPLPGLPVELERRLLAGR